MKCKFTTFTIACTIIHLFMVYYTITFNLIYLKSADALIQAVLLSFFLDWFIVEIGTQFIQAGFRALAIKYKTLKYYFNIKYNLDS